MPHNADHNADVFAHEHPDNDQNYHANEFADKHAIVFSDDLGEFDADDLGEFEPDNKFDHNPNKHHHVLIDDKPHVDAIFKSHYFAHLDGYVDRYLRLLQAAAPGKPPRQTIVLCNRTDECPCPLPEIACLMQKRPQAIFLAGSALRGTNMAPLWRFVETCAAPRLQGA